MPREYIESRRKIQSSLLDFLENEDDNEIIFQNFINTLNEEKISLDKTNFSDFLHILAAIINNHHVNIHFFKKIEHIFQHFKSLIQQFYTKKEIFNIFKENKRILLFLIEEEMITFDIVISRELNKQKSKYYHYFHTSFFV